MIFDKRLSLNFNAIEEQLDRLFDLVDRFKIINSSNSLIECNFSNLKEKDISHIMREWLKDVNRYFKSYDNEPLIRDGVNYTLSLYNNTLDECRRLSNLTHPTKIELSTLNGDVKLLNQLEKSINDFSKRLDNYFIMNINIYLEDVHDTMVTNQNNNIVCRALVNIENALQRKQERIINLKNQINENMN